MMADSPTTILKNYSKTLSEALLEVYKHGPKQHIKLNMDFSCAKNLNYDELRETIHYHKLVDTFAGVKYPCVYCFEILGDYDSEQVWDCFHLFKGKGKHRLPRTKKTCPRDTNILYLGKVKFNLLRRMKEHFGFTSATKTQSLQLYHWAAELGLTLEINVLEFQQETSNLVGAFEFKLAREMKTILGSHTT